MYILIEERKKWCFMNIILLNFMIQFFLSLLLLHGWLRPGASNDISLEIKDQNTSHFSLHVDHKHSTMFYAKNFCQGISLIFKVKNKTRWCKEKDVKDAWVSLRQIAVMHTPHRRVNVWYSCKGSVSILGVSGIFW